MFVTYLKLQLVLTNCIYIYILLVVAITVILMWVKQCHKAPIWELFIPTIYGDLGDGFICVLPTRITS